MLGRAARYGLISAAVAAVSASGQITSTYDPVTQTVTMVDSSNGAVLVSPTGAVKVYDTSWDFHGGETPLAASSITFTAKPDGYDITVHLANTTGSAQRAGTLWVANMPFSDTTYRRTLNYFQWGDAENPATWNMYGNWFPGGEIYPGGCYSPAHVIRGWVTPPPPALTGGSTRGTPAVARAVPLRSHLPQGGQSDGGEVEPIPDPEPVEYAIGISILYPVLDYDVSVFKAQQALWGQWRMGFHINPKWRSTTGGDPHPLDPDWCGSYNPDGEIPSYNAEHPHAHEREFTVCVRVLKNPSTYPAFPAEWLRTLDPYREYFQKTYGAPRYEADLRPIEGVTLAQTDLYNATTNPFGYNAPRPDLWGWGDVVDDLDYQTTTLGWPRRVLWAPSGVSGAGLNYRYEFTSHWQDMPNIASTMPLLMDYGFRSHGLGLWWGRSTEVMWDWDTAYEEGFDQRDTGHRARAFEELDGARAVCAREIGLDQYVLSRRAGFAWFEEMKLRYPEMRFTGEAFQSDIFHVLGANFESMGAWPQGTDESSCVPPNAMILPLAMPDFLLQNHETWGAEWLSRINTNDCSSSPPWTTNTPEVEHWLDYVSDQGYAPLINLGSGQMQNINAADATGAPTYTITVPSDLRTSFCPKVTAQPPVKLMEACGSTVVLSATAMSPRSLTLSYQWYFRPWTNDPANDTLPDDLVLGMMEPVVDEVGKWQDSDTASMTVTIGPKTLGTYRLLVTEPGGGPTWTAYTLVMNRADVDKNGYVDSDDWDLYLDLYFDGYNDPRDDVNLDWAVDGDDLSDFITAYLATGC